jgi:hypothetical protein
VILNAGGDAIATSEFLDSTPEGMYFQASTSVLPNLGDLVSLGISSTGGGTYSHFFEISDSGYQVWSEGIAFGSVTAFTSPAIFSMYSDSAIIYFMVDGVTVQSNRITASSYQAFVSGTTLTTPPHSVTNIRFYPTGKVGATGPTGPAGPDTYTTADAAWWDTSAPTTITNAIDRLAYAFYTAAGAIPVLP